jgi:hypothetical protein
MNLATTGLVSNVLDTIPDAVGWRGTWNVDHEVPSGDVARSKP